MKLLRFKKKFRLKWRDKTYLYKRNCLHCPIQPTLSFMVTKLHCSVSPKIEACYQMRSVYKISPGSHPPTNKPGLVR